jgi:Primase C terminal 2 (PriCT-2)/RepB DNA-primase from phage plasmid
MNAPNASPRRDAEQATQFLKLLDPKARGLTFQTFDDNDTRKNSALAKVVQSAAYRALLQLYVQGAGVFITINETDGKGRRSENVVRIRAVFQEDDDGFDGPFPLAPSIVVETSPGHFHRYWLVDDDWRADEQGRIDFAAVMERMVESYGSDKNAKDLCRVMRVPGFLHRKTETHHMVRMVEASGRRYNRAEIIAAFPPVERAKKTHTERAWAPQGDDEQRIRDALFCINADDRDIWLQCGMALKDHFGGAGRPLWDEWSGQSAKYDERDQEQTWRSFKRNGITIATVFHHAKLTGWRDERIHHGASNNAERGGDDWKHAGTAQADETVADGGAAPERPWPLLDSAAYYGLAGEVVRTIEPHTESDPVGILLGFLTTFGNIVNNNPYYQVESDRHHTNLNVVYVGASAKGRKGTADGRVKAVTKPADETWFSERMASGLSTGEGLINAVRDEVQKWDAKAQQNEVVDPGVADKRLMVTEPEFAGALSAMERHGNTLSPVIRNAWDGKKLQTITKGSPIKATGAHISIIAHITEDEVRARLTRTEMANGFANRFLFCCVKRSKFLPHGGALADADLANLSQRVKNAVEFARRVGRVKMTKEAAQAWEAAYPELSADRSGLVGAVTARSEAQVIRLALIYALLDSQDAICPQYLEAAMAVWAYCEASALRIFGTSLGDPVADDILRALRQSGACGMTRTAISSLFARNRSSDQIRAALALLTTKGFARAEPKMTNGRSSEVWFAVGRRQ